MSDTAAAQLRRILQLIPECADEKLHPIAQLAARAGVDAKTLLRDVRTLGDRFDDPAAFVEAVQIFVDGQQVRVVADHFLRPMRLTLAELAALDLGLSLLRADRPPEEWPALDKARARLDKAMAKVPREEGEGPRPIDSARHATMAPSADPATLSLLRRAYRQRCKVNLEYLKADSTERTRRVVCPCAIVFSSGHWYLVAQCDGVDGIRIFRVDRIVAVAITEARYQVPPDFAVDALLRDGRAFASTVDEKVRIRFSPKVARWIAERDGGDVAADGSYEQELPLADLNWLGRYVMQYGAEAEVLGPPAARRAVRERLEQTAGLL